MSESADRPTPQEAEKAAFRMIREGDMAGIQKLMQKVLRTFRPHEQTEARKHLKVVLLNLRERLQREGDPKLEQSLISYLREQTRKRQEKAQEQRSLDEKVVESLQNGDGWAYYHMQRMYFPSVRTMVHLQGGTDEDAEDVIMESIHALLSNIQKGAYQVQDSARLKTYFMRICRNIWVDEIKRKSRLRGIKPLHEILDSELLEDPAAELEESELLSERQQVVRQIFDEATETCRNVLSLFYYENLSHEEIAERMGYKNAETSKTQKLKCITKLRKAVQSKIDELY